MCGITGFLGLDNQKGNLLETTVKHMADTLDHRGPDDNGVWVDTETGIALGHRRLSIVDLSSTGHQPMHSACGRYVIVFNGEIYNFKTLRQELESLGHKFRGHSDTEVMLTAISQWGLEAAVKCFNGMFAFALWDKQEHRLHLARDRLGEKPLYYGWMGKMFLFGSELKALCAHPDFKKEINRDVLALYLRHNYVPSPYSIYKGINKLQPGTILTLNRSDSTSTPAPLPYWSAREVAEHGITRSFTGSADEAVDQLDSLLREAVKMRMEADVPLGAFLSGGVDSSLVVALMQAQSDIPIKTFSIGFNESEYNEANYAKAVAQHLGTDHTELYITPEQAMAVIPRLPTLYDEPFADSSQIPTFLVSELARRYVTVSLSGDGGDELFAGYNRYFLGQSLWNKIGWMPKRIRQAASGMLTAISPQTWETMFQKMKYILPGKIKQQNPGDKLHKLSEILDVEDQEALYLRFVSHWKDPSSLVPGAREPPTALTDRSQWADLPDFTQRMMFLDTVTYLPDDILVKVDRASMGVSLEARVPLLDHRVMEFAWRLPMSMKIRNGQSKWILRQVLYKYVPRELIERPKMGFGVPIDSWLRGPLREWAEVLLDEKRIREEGFFNHQPIREKWAEHLSGKRNWQYYLWDVLMFQAWLDEN
ncbi:MAG: asparagine synthase (glutamine-hydrolyzing) [Euryarchaeota archaeon]|nr:asparagine synthase (glutamine-hydrolyzing) [Euryarchaeota archaeon]MBU4140064.1 asparagine synthase (glutamine-hydrolyzing) [Euryarchaeota archaeon]